MAVWAEEIIGPCRLIQGDMRDVLPALACQADLVQTDPPYRLTAGGNTTGEMAGMFAQGVYDNSGEIFPIVEWVDLAPLLFAASAEDADAIMMTSDREEGEARAALLGAGFGFHRLLVWDKGTVTPNRWFMPNCEFGLYLWKGRARSLTDCAAKQLVYWPNDDKAGHPTGKPVGLMQHWMRLCSDPGDLVLDPFMGCGSVMVAAARSGRRGIGIELSSAHFDVACQRVERALREGPSDDLFAEVAA